MVHQLYAVSIFALPPLSNCSAFTRDGVEENTEENQEGVYIIMSRPKGRPAEDRWVYVGQGVIRDRLTRHLSYPHITDANPTHWIAMLCANEEERIKRETWLIENLSGLVNRQHNET